MKNSFSHLVGMQLRSSIILLLLLGACSVSARQGVVLQDELEKKLLSFRFEEARQILTSFSDKALASYYECNILIYQYASTQDRKYLIALDQIWENAVEKIEKSYEGDVLQEVLISDIYGKRAMIAFLDRKYFQAIRYTRSAYKMIEKSYEKYGDDVEQMKMRGLFNTLLGAIPQKYLWISNTLGYRGNVEQGKTQLQAAAQKSRILRHEAVFILCYVEKNMLNETERSLKRMEQERATGGPNILIDFTLASVYMNVKKNEKALDILNRRGYYSQKGIFFIPYWDYLLGKAYYYKEKYGISQMYFSRFLKSYQGKLYKNDAYFRLAMSLALDNKYDKAQAYFSLIADGEADGLDEDEYAAYMAKRFSSRSPNDHEQYLFRARNLFDGGYLDQAEAKLKTLQSLHFSNLEVAEKTEFYYRFGRIYHSKGNHKEAISFYKSCMKEGPSDQSWQQAYASYYSGQILQKIGDVAGAITYYEQALGYDHYFYEAGLQNRCKIALERARKEQKSQASAANKR